MFSCSKRECGDLKKIKLMECNLIKKAVQRGTLGLFLSSELLFRLSENIPPDMQCKDKFLLQSTIVPPHANVDELPPNTFNKDSDGKVIQEMKLRVVYMPPSSTQGNLGDEVLLEASEQSLDADANSVSFIVFVVCYS
ncbi:VESICLE-ASSOCIATED MEMBRANE PROTEIN-ASSOCIATED PROTEIN [Salix koriyanagi]|uniref:VESICLE-ASSOCIATED MEMBRANE PROTEIN-ASSOCIATED PROTEIN n=1 Tax=Salix koriyanagi TaxID=2511006 RepID=A0A9Q0Q7W0_9ROSI|nr:VESICLE-ASSOCIATED MEMBRANE PROTEIN-ASSOCIATED PROTEIN [Salix koriyanagi]